MNIVNYKCILFCMTYIILFSDDKWALVHLFKYASEQLYKLSNN